MPIALLGRGPSQAGPGLPRVCAGLGHCQATGPPWSTVHTRRQQGVACVSLALLGSCRSRGYVCRLPLEPGVKTVMTPLSSGTPAASYLPDTSPCCLRCLHCWQASVCTAQSRPRKQGAWLPLLGAPPTALWTRGHMPLDQQPARKLQLRHPERPAARGRKPSAKDNFPPPKPWRSSWMLGPAVFSIREHWVPNGSPAASKHPPAQMPLVPTLLPEGSPQ